MKVSGKKIIQWTILSALMLVGTFAFLLMAGEDDAENPMSVWTFLSIKAIGLLAFTGCFYAGRHLDRHGLLPDIRED